jgi:hypothetical protein
MYVVEVNDGTKIRRIPFNSGTMADEFAYQIGKIYEVKICDENGGEYMNWKSFLGDALYNRMTEYLNGKKMTIATFVRFAIESYLEAQK